MRVLFANNYYYLRGGSERILQGEMELLAQSGHRVTIFTRRLEKNDPAEYEDLFPPDLSHGDVPFINNVKVAFNRIHASDASRALGAVARVFRPDLLHAHNVYGRLGTSVLSAAQRIGVPAVITLHDYRLICPTYLLLRNASTCDICVRGQFYRCLSHNCHEGGLAASLVQTMESYANRWLKRWESAAKFLCVSRFMLKQFLHSGIDKSKLVHLPNFVRTDRCNPRFEPGEYALFVGRLSREKGVHTLVDAVRGTCLKLRIVGDGPEMAALKRRVKQARITNVRLMGFRAGKELEALYHGAAFVVVPSEWYETFGLTVGEAFAYGKPVIGSEIGAIPELVRHEENGLLFAPGNVEDLREKMLQLRAMNDRIQGFGRSGRELMKTQFNPTRHLAKLLEVYESVR